MKVEMLTKYFKNPLDLSGINKFAYIETTVFFTTLLGIIKTFVFSDFRFLTYLSVLVFLDTVVGVWRAWKEKRLSNDGFGLFIGKLIVYAILLILTHVLVHFEIDGQKNVVFVWVNYAAYTALMAKEGFSIVSNIEAIRPGLIPKILLDKLQSYTKENPKEETPKP